MYAVAGAAVPAANPAAASRARPWHHGPVLNGLLTGYQATGDGRGRRPRADDPPGRRRPATRGRGRCRCTSPPRRWWCTRPPAGCCCAGTSSTSLWLQVGGHADPGESDPLRIALREAREETGLTDLVPWPDASLRHAAVCYVPPVGDRARARARRPAVLPGHRRPGRGHPGERAVAAALAELDEARDLVGGNNLRDTLDRIDGRLARLPRAWPVRPGRTTGIAQPTNCRRCG